MSFEMAPCRPIYDESDEGPDDCPDCSQHLESGWDYCPGCGDSIDSMDSDKSDFLCSCSNTRLTVGKPSQRNARDEPHECSVCGAIWRGLRWGDDGEEREPDSWNEDKARKAFATHLKALYGFDLPEKVSA